MVARKFAAGRAVAVATVATLLIGIFPMPTAAAQAVTTVDISVRQGSAQFYQSSFKSGTVPTQFLDGAPTAVLKVPVFQDGPTPLENVSVYWMLHNTTLNPIRAGCTKVTIPGPSVDADNNVQPGNATANITVDVGDLPVGGYNITVSALKPLGSNVPNCTNPVTRHCSQVTPPSLTNPSPSVPSCIADRDDGTTQAATGQNAVDDNTRDDNRLNAYFVKGAFLNLEVADVPRWCEGNTGNPCDTAESVDMLGADGKPYNVTIQPEGEGNPTQPTFFETLVRNTGTWHNMSNWGGPCNCSGDGFTYELNTTITGRYINGSLWASATTSTARGNLETAPEEHRARSGVFDLVNRSGRYNVTIQLDPKNLTRRASGDNSVDRTQRDADVLYRDYTVNITTEGLRTNPSNPYPYEGSSSISGVVTFWNNGTAAPLVPANSNYFKVNYTVYIDNLTGGDPSDTNDDFVLRVSPGEWLTYTTTTLGADSALTVPFTFSYTSTGGDVRYIPPGKHTIYAVIDRDNSTLELNETNNNVSVDIFIRDTTKPKLLNVPKFTVGPVTTPELTEFLPVRPFNIHVNASDDDNGLNVSATFTLASNESVTRTYYGKKVGDNEVHYAIQPFDFNFHNFSARDANGSEAWNVKVIVRDSFDNNVTSSTRQIRLVPYPIHNATPEFVVVAPTYPQKNISWASQEEPYFKILLPANMTGYYGGSSGVANQQNYTGNLALNITTAKGRTFNQNASFWHPGTNETCLTNRTGDPGNVVNGITSGVTSSPTCTDPTGVDTFDTGFLKNQDGAGPGLWNYSVRITDVAGHTRILNGTLHIVDEKPYINQTSLSNTSVDPGQSFTIKANVSDDAREIAGAYVNFTRIVDNTFVNFTLTPDPTPILVDNLPHYIYNNTIQTGRGKMLGIGGAFNVTFAVKDAAGNWNTSGLGNFTVNDQDVPVLLAYGARPETAELGENITFFASIRDSTNVSARLEIFRGEGVSELLFDPIEMTEGLDGNFTVKLNFTTENRFAYRITPFDSTRRNGLVGNGVVLVRDNLGPKYEVRSPGVIIDGIRYGSATPEIQIAAIDIEGVVPSSIDVKIGPPGGPSIPVDFSVVPAPGNLNGFLIIAPIKPAKKFNHNDLVAVNVTAQDNSTEHLQSWLNFTFTVDDVAPIARLKAVSPSYRDQQAHLLNVSLASRFEIVAEDNDGVPTGVESIRYSILRANGPSSANTIYTQPFTVKDSGVYTGPTEYQIQYQAEDAVGNLGKPNITKVYVDETAPALFQFFPQGRSINATFVDDRVGVNRSVVWYRVNNEPFVPLPLVEKDGAWSLTLPEGVKGDKVAYYLQAWDKLDNPATFGNASAPYASFDVSNHEPKIKLTNPIDGSRIFRTIDLTWDASDEDGDALVFTIFFKRPGSANFQELAKIENSASRRYSLDTTRFADGQYTFRVAAGDGGFVKLTETTVTILNRASANGVITIDGPGVPGSMMLVKAEITKAEAIVEAQLYLGDDLVGSYPMNDEGRDGDEKAGDGFYSVRVPVDAAGDYRVEIFTQYRENGELKTERSDPQVFSAKLTPGYILTEYGAVIALIGLLAAVGIGVAVFVVMRRR